MTALHMDAFLAVPGFLGTRARLYADLSLLLVLLTAALFTIGWRLAVKRRYEAHRRIQMLAVALSALAALFIMIPSFVIYILPGIPDKLLEGTYGITTVHAILGALSLCLGLFVVLRAHERVPRRMRFRNYKLFMRWSYALYMLSTLLGFIVYWTVYVSSAAG
jgi:putative membrane protein